MFKYQYQTNQTSAGNDLVSQHSILGHAQEIHLGSMRWVLVTEHPYACTVHWKPIMNQLLMHEVTVDQKLKHKHIWVFRQYEKTVP
jgi:hypothetical protein